MRVLVRALVGLLVVPFAACQRPAAPPNVVMVVLDTLRADHLGSYGDRRGLTPFLDGLATRGVRFERAYATSSWTMPSVASLFTARYPVQHGVHTMQSKLADGETTLAEALSARGWVAAGFSANLLVGAPHGFGQGFDPYVAFAVEEGAAKVRGATLRSHSQRWLDQRRPGEPPAPLLLFYQFMEPHAPYEPPEPWRSRFVRPHAAGEVEEAARVMAAHKIWNRPAEQIALLASLYDGEVAAADEELRLLFADLERRDVLDNAVVVITADHGEEFGDHGGLSHGFTLFEEQVRVPLLILAPGLAPAVIERSVSLIDVAPTVLALAGVAVPPAFEGRSLLPLLRGEAAPAPGDLMAELESMGPRKGMRKHQQALLRGDHKLLRSPNPFVAPQLFDLAADPGERHPNPPAMADQLQTMLDDLSQLQARLAERASPASAPVVLDEATREKLRALGYE